MWNRVWHQTRNRSGLFEYNVKTWNEWLSNSCCTTMFPPLSIIPSHRAYTLLTDTTSLAPTLLFLKIVGGTAAIITVIYKILSIRYQFHCCSRVDGPVQKWAGDLWNLTNAISLCLGLLFKHKEMPASIGWKASSLTGRIKAAYLRFIIHFLLILRFVGGEWEVCLHVWPVVFFFYLCFISV